MGAESSRDSGCWADVFFVLYKGQVVGEYFADIIVEKTVVLELKCVEHLGKEHMAQCLNYLRASGMEVCLLINFQRAVVEWKRVALTLHLTN